MQFLKPDVCKCIPAKWQLPHALWGRLAGPPAARRGGPYGAMAPWTHMGPYYRSIQVHMGLYGAI